MPHHTNEYWMEHAFKLAQKGKYTTSPNPCVGCIIVKNNKVIGSGWHQCAGQNHAEIEALLNLPKNLQDTTMYVTLEPCFHHGKTPPCVEEIIKRKIPKVVIASEDPNILTSSKSIKKLKENNVEVLVGILHKKNLELNAGFFKNKTLNMPFVVSKIAQSIDGKTALLNKKSKWITSEESRNDSQLLRAQSCVILTGIGTVLADNPKMNIRANTALQLLSINNQQVRKPLVAICDSELKTPIKAKIIDQNPIIFHASENKTKIINLKKNGATCVYAKDKKTNKVDLEFVLRYLATNNCNQVMLEAGSTLNGAFLEKNLIDEVVLYIAPCILGSGFSSFDISIEKIENKKEFSINNMEKIGKDIKITMAKNS